MRHYFYLLLLLFVCTLHPQIGVGQEYRYETTVPVQLGQQFLQMPWTGGLNTVQLSEANVDGEGLPELVLFDRSSSQVQVFAQTTEGWLWLPEERRRFPEDIRSWLQLVDYNGDGRKDLFTYTTAGIRVFENKAAANAPADWQLAYPLLYYPGSTGAVNLLVNSYDVPLIADTDGDGDTDLASFDPAGRGTIRWYKNVGVEQFGRTDTLVFELADRQWGGITECGCRELTLNYLPCPEERGSEQQRPMHAGGKSLLWQDVTGDGIPDLLLGDEECTLLYYLPNSGTAASPVFHEVQLGLPEATATPDFPFPAAYSIQNNIIISSNLRNAGARLDLRNSVWRYAPQAGGGYALQQKDFLQAQMLDVGEEARPTFLDIDADNDLDLLVGSKGTLHADGYYASLQLFENTGTSSAPAFQLKEDDFLGLSASKFSGVQPQAIDFNKDGATDLVLSVWDNTANKVRTFVYLNKAAPGSPALFEQTAFQELALPLQSQEYPYFYDVTADGLPDVLVGRFDGSLQLYTNTGTLAAPTFALSDEAYKGFALDNARRPLIPTVGDADADGLPDLLLADGAGGLRILYDFLRPAATAGEAIEATAEQGGEQLSLRLGDKSWPVLANLWAGEAPALVVGQIGGGLVLLRSNQELIPGEEQEYVLEIYPNPAINRPITIHTNAPARLRVLDMLGQVVRCFEISGRQPLLWYPQLPAGMYIIEATFAGERVTKKVILAP